MVEESTHRWAFLTSHARALICIARDPGARLRDIGEHVGITERAAHRIVTDLLAAGYITRTREGRRNWYTINTHLPLPDPVARDQSVGDLLAVLAATKPTVPARKPATPEKQSQRVPIRSGGQ